MQWKVRVHESLTGVPSRSLWIARCPVPRSPLQPRAVDIDALLDDGWARVPKGKPFRCFVSSATYQIKRGKQGRGEVPAAGQARAQGLDVASSARG